MAEAIHRVDWVATNRETLLRGEKISSLAFCRSHWPVLQHIFKQLGTRCAVATTIGGHAFFSDALLLPVTFSVQSRYAALFIRGESKGPIDHLPALVACSR